MKVKRNDKRVKAEDLYIGAVFTIENRTYIALDFSPDKEVGAIIHLGGDSWACARVRAEACVTHVNATLVIEGQT